MNAFTIRQSLAVTAASIAVAGAIAMDQAWQGQVEADITRVLPAIAEVPALTQSKGAPPAQIAAIAPEQTAGDAVSQTAKRRSSPAVTGDSQGHYQMAVVDAPVAVYSDAVSPLERRRLETVARMQARAAQFRVWANEAEHAPERFVAHAEDDANTVEQKRARYTARMLGKAQHLRVRAEQIEAKAERLRTLDS